MPPSFAHSVRVPAEEEHAGEPGTENDRAHPTDALHAPARESLQHGRFKKPEGVAAGIGKEKSRG